MPVSRRAELRAADPASRTYCHLIDTTILHLLGIEHEKLTFRHNCIDCRLTDVHGHMIDRIVA